MADRYEIPVEFYKIVRRLAETHGEDPEEFLEQRIAPMILLVEHLVYLAKPPKSARESVPGYL